MLEILKEVFNVVLPVILCAGVGFAIAILKVPFDTKMIGRLVANVGYPTLVIAHLSASKVDLGSFGLMVAAALAMLASYVVIVTVLLKILGLPLRAFLSPMTLGNVGNIGLPITALAFGDAGLTYSFAFLLVVLLGIFTYGTWVPKNEFTLRALVASPVIYAIAIALVLLGTGTALPAPLHSTFKILGGLAIPLMLLTLGYTLATLTVSSFWRGALLAVLHLAMTLGVALVLVALFGFTGTERGVFVLMAVMPSSVATYLFVELYVPERASDVASLILVSTLMTIVVLPLLLTYAV